MLKQRFSDCHHLDVTCKQIRTFRSLCIGYVTTEDDLDIETPFLINTVSLWICDLSFHKCCSFKVNLKPVDIQYFIPPH